MTALDVSALLAKRRRAMQVGRTSMHLAMNAVTVGGETLLSRVEAILAGTVTAPGLSPEDLPELRIRWAGAMQFDRTRPAVAGWAALIGVNSDAKLDALFRLAMAFEAETDTDAPQAALQNLLES